MNGSKYRGAATQRERESEKRRAGGETCNFVGQPLAELRESVAALSLAFVPSFGVAGQRPALNK